jgi:hypothetical protein
MDHCTYNNKEIRSLYSWKSRKDALLKREFTKKPDDLFQLETWKTLAEALQGEVYMGQPSLNSYYQQYLTNVYQRSFIPIQTEYYRCWVDYIVSMIAKKVTKSNVKFILESPGGLMDIVDEKFNVEGILVAEKRKRRMKVKGRKQREKKPAPPPLPFKKKKPEDFVVFPSDDLICQVCAQHEFPEARWKSLHLSDNYLKHLEETQHLRKPGYTGNAAYWDPRVFIKCSECATIVHCGCPLKPIKQYPSR